MTHFDRKKHWEDIYQSKKIDEFSWFQPEPIVSLELIKQVGISPSAKVIDIGGGDSLFVDHLIKLGFTSIAVLDISQTAIDRAKNRVNQENCLIKWINSDITTFVSSEKYDLWHDRATFHFLIEEKEIENYMQLLKNNIKKDGIVVIGTFSENGPKKCSGIEIKQYSENSMNQLFADGFQNIKFKTVQHITPNGNSQNFIFGCFKKK